MCEFTSSNNKRRAMQFFRRNQIGAQDIHGLFGRFPYALQEGHCPKCGRYLEGFERRPDGRATRSMCLDDYEYWVAGRMSNYCFVCARSLPEEKIYDQRRNNREVKHHMHDGVCTYIWTVIHNVSVGEPDFVQRFGKSLDRIVVIGFSKHFNRPDDATTTNWLPAHSGNRLRSPTHISKALPYPKTQEKIPIRRSYNGKAVKALTMKMG